MTLGETIKEQRNKKGLSQEKVAELVGTSRQAVTKWEAGQSIPCMENLLTLAEIFDISLSELTSGVNDKISIDDAVDVTTQKTPKKSALLPDIFFVFIAVVAVWSIFRIPAYIGFSMAGFLLIVVQTAAVIYVPIYLLWLRPRWLRTGNKNEGAKEKPKVAVKAKILTGISASAFLFLGYLLCARVFWFLHGMGQWPIILFVFGLIVICISTLVFARIVMIGTIAGYIIGFALGMIFGRFVYMDVGDELLIPRHNNWEIWTVSYLLVITASIVWERLYRKSRNKHL